MTGRPTTAIRVISLRQATLRQRAFIRQAEASSAALSWSFFSARQTIDPDLDYDPQQAIVARGRALHPREVACYSSHYAVWRSFLEGADDQLVVIEDDVVLDWLFLEHLLALDLTKAGVHYLKLFSKNATPAAAVSNDFLGRWLIDCRGFAYGTQAYLLTRTGAERFLRHCRQVLRPIDDEMDRSWAHGVPNLSVFPFPAYEQVSPSHIGAERDAFEPLPIGLQAANIASRLQERVRRLTQRVTGYGLCRKLEAFPSRSWTEQPKSNVA